MDDPFPRTLGNRAMHSLSLQRHLHEQMQSNSELCDVTLVVNQVVSQMDIARIYKHLRIMYQNLQFTFANYSSSIGNPSSLERACDVSILSIFV